MDTFSFTAFPIFLLFFAAVVCLFVVVALYRRLISPLHEIPGPLVAAISGVWLWIGDITGSAPRDIKDLHRSLGPMVRIGPNEVSIDDVNVHNSVLYCQAPKFMKAAYFYDPFKTGPSGIFQTSEPKEHSILRRLVSRPFSRKSILEFEPQIWDSTKQLTEVLRQTYATDAVFDLSKMSRCLSLDFITKFTYGESMEAVRAPGFHDDILDAFDSFAVSNYLFMMIPSLRRPSIALLSMLPFKVFQAIPRMRERVKRALEKYERAEKPTNASKFQPLLQAEREASIVQSYPLTEDFLIADGLADIFAGTDTTSTTLTLTLLQIFTNGTIYDRLHQELKEAMPGPDGTARLCDLESLPYLSACVKEGLRFSTPVRSRLPRVTPAPGFIFDGHLIPAGTLISSNPYLMDFNEKIFQPPESFLPDRWLVDDPVALKRLENAWAPFSKGSRGCIGINLALAEVYITLASLVRRFKLKSRDEGEIKIREVFGVIFLSPIFVRLASMTE